MKNFIIVFTLVFVFVSCGGHESPTDQKNETDGYFQPSIKGQNKPPVAPYQQKPAENEKVFSNVRLTWNCYDPDGDPILYDVYVNGSIVASSISNQFYEANLKSGLTYVWFICASDNKGHKTQGPVWQFSTFPLVYIADSVVVSPSSYLSWKMDLKKDDKIEGQITSDSDVNVWLLSQLEFDFFVNEQAFNFFREGSSQRVRDLKFSFSVPESGEYRIVLDNTFSWLTSKLVSISVLWSHY